MSEIKWIKITTDMFEDDKIDFITNLPEADAIIVIWIRILTLAGKSNAGGYVFLTEKIPYTDEMLAHKFKKPLNIIKLALETFIRLDMIDMDERGIFLPNWEKHQNIEALEMYRERERARKQEYRERKRLSLLNGTMSGTCPGQSHENPRLDIDKEEDIDKEINKKNTRQLKYDEDSPPYKMAFYLLTKIQEWTDKIGQPNMQKWADDCRKILDLDKRHKALVKDVIDWATKDDFWQANILSPATLRKQFEKLCIQMDKTRSKTGGEKGGRNEERASGNATASGSSLTSKFSRGV